MQPTPGPHAAQPCIPADRGRQGHAGNWWRGTWNTRGFPRGMREETAIKGQALAMQTKSDPDLLA